MQALVAAFSDEVEPVSSPARSRSMVCRGIIPPAMVLVLTLDKVTLWTIVCFFGAIDARERLRKDRGFGLNGRKFSSVDSKSQ